MNDPPGIPSVLGIESVEWVSEGGENLTVRVTGRWRRRRPAWSGQPMLVIDVSGRRHRFPAMPEPPSLTGAGPGTWRISFAVPAALAPDLGGRTWLQFGAVVVPLPAAVEPLGAGTDPAEGGTEVAEVEAWRAEGVDPGSHPQSSELETENARRRAGEAQELSAELARRVQELERDLAATRRQAEQLSASLADRELTRRAAEQRAHAEQALRRDLARQLATRSDQGERARQALGELAAAEERIRELEAELLEARRRGDEAEQAVAAAAAARERAERRAALAETRADPARAEAQVEAEARGEDEDELEAPPDMVAAPLAAAAAADQLKFERGLMAQRVSANLRIPAEPAPLATATGASPAPAAAVPPAPPALSTPTPVSTPPAASGPPAVSEPPPTPPPDVPPSRPGPEAPEAGPEALIAALRRELEARAAAEPVLRARVIEAENRLAARVLLDRRTTSVLGELRRELDGLRATVERERSARLNAERRADELLREAGGHQERSRQAYQAIAELRATLETLGGAASERERPEVEPTSATPTGSAPAEPAPAEPAPAEPAPAEPAPANTPAADTGPAETGPVETAPVETGPAETAPAETAPAETAPVKTAPTPPAQLRSPQTGVPGQVEPQRLNEALVRLRESVAPRDPAHELGPVGQPTVPARGNAWLEPVFRALVRTDANGAGRLLLALLPAQRAADPSPVAYDLVLGGLHGCVRVTVRDGAPVIRHADGPRPAGDVDFQVFGEPAEVARLLTAGALRRRFGRGVARVRGKRARLASLRSLVQLRLDLQGLHAVGVRLEPELALRIAAQVIDPAWTAPERFTIGYAGEGATVYLTVRHGQPVKVAEEAPAGKIDTSIAGPPDGLMPLLWGERSEQLKVSGDEWPLALLRKWIKRAQSD